MKRLFASGAEKRKKQKVLKINEASFPKLDAFFPSATTSRESQQHVQPDVDIELAPDHITATSLATEATEVEIARGPATQHVQDYQDATATATGSGTQSLEMLDRGNRCCDAGLWTELSKDDIAYWVEKGSEECQNANGSFQSSRRSYVTKGNKTTTRMCNTGFFYSKKVNGEQYKRDWLIYSPKNGSVYCFVCKLFSESSSSLSHGGFSDWRNSAVLHHHEHSNEHRNALLTYLTRRRGSGLDSKLDEAIKREREYWQHVLKRVIAVICTLAERGLAFRGSSESFGSQQNGNYLGLLELVAEFDPFLATHIEKFGNSGSGYTSYLSKTTCDELIHMMANKVRKSIIEELTEAGYFSLSVDSTPDNSHIDQLTIVVRYVSPTDGKPVERFLNFIPIESHTGEDLANVVMKYLCTDCEIDFGKCRGQSYDNAANMSGRYNGMQQKILERNRYAVYIPCAGHSLNLVGRAAVDSCLEAVNFFSLVQQIYTFFSASTHRWTVLEQNLDDAKVPKRLSDTRWDAHANSTEAVSQGYEAIGNALIDIFEDESQKGDTRAEASNIYDKMHEFEFALMLEFWNDVLVRFRKTSKALQDDRIALSTCTNLYKSLQQYVFSVRDEFDNYEENAKLRLPDVEYRRSSKRPVARRRQINDGDAAEVSLSPKDKFRVETFIPMVDALVTNLAKRAEVYSEVASNFSFLTQLHLTQEEIREQSVNLIATYPEDIDDSIVSDVHQFHAYVRASNPTGEMDNRKYSHQDLYDIIMKDGIKSAFPNVEVVLRMFLSLMVTNCTGERSFSQLKRIKNELRSTMKQDRLSSLSLLCIECEQLRKIRFDDIIADYARQKCRKKIL